MSDKIIRDELLRSHRYQALSSDTAKLLFTHLLLASDHLSNAEATTTNLSIIMGRSMTEEVSATLLSELADRDLIRIYHDNGKRYIHIPRSRQRIRFLTSKHPRPPESIEDADVAKQYAAALEKHLLRTGSEINSLQQKVRRASDVSMTHVGRREEKRRTSTTKSKAYTATELPTDEHRQIAAASGIDCSLEFAKYSDWLAANGKQHKNRNAGFRNWLRKAAECKRLRPKSRHDALQEVAAEIMKPFQRGEQHGQRQELDITGSAERIADSLD